MSTRRLYLLDGMALAYRAHFAFIRNPIRTSAGANTSAVFGFTNTLLELIEKRRPTHLALVLDTDAPTFRHQEYPEYKAQRDDMPEDLAAALPGIRRLAGAMGIPVLAADGYEADDLIGTLAKQAVREDDTEVYMVTPDKDFAQLVEERIFIYRPGRQGSEAEVLGLEAVQKWWEVERADQVADVLGLMGDASDNIPGVPGIGEKTAKKLIARFGSMEALLDGLDQLKGKQKERLEESRDQALLCKRLVTIDVEAPVELDWDSLEVGGRNEEDLAALMAEFEFNTLGKRLLGGDFQAGRGRGVSGGGATQGMLLSEMQTMERTDTDYRRVDGAAAAAQLAGELAALDRFSFDTETDSLDARRTRLLGIAFSWRKGQGVFLVAPDAEDERRAVIEAVAPAFQAAGVEKVGQNVKFDLGVLAAHGLRVEGPFFDTMLAHALVHPDQRHGMDFMAESLLGYTPVPISDLIGPKGKGQRTMHEVFAERPDDVVAYACEDADITLQLADVLRPALDDSGMHPVFADMECPLIPVLAAMEAEGIRIDRDRLAAIGRDLQDQAATLKDRVLDAAGMDFNLNSPRQLGQVLFEHLKLVEKPRKTKTGQYVTSEQVLADLAPKHPIVRDVLDYREVTKLKNTYVDTLPGHADPETGRVHTTFHQLVAATGRLASTDPNLQNIPVRTDLGRGIRDAFVARDDGFLLLAADYSQIELRIMASLSGDAGLREAFARGQDIHTATAARVYGVDEDAVDGEMRRRAKMVNFGIIYGISAFGLAQRLGIPRGDAAEIIDAYFTRYPGVKAYMDRTIEEARESGFVHTLGGRRRPILDLGSSNPNVRGGAERIAINTPIQGAAADMIKLAMLRVDEAMRGRELQSRLLLQVHDELVFDMARDEEAVLKPLVEEAMVGALPLEGVPVVVEMGTGRTWLEAH